MNLDEAAVSAGTSVDWLANAVSTGLIHTSGGAANPDVPTEEVAYLRRTRKWLPHFVDAIHAEGIGSAVLFGRDAEIGPSRQRDSVLVTTVEAADEALRLNATLSDVAGRTIYVVTWSSATSNPAIAWEAAVNGRIVRDQDRVWGGFLEEATMRLTRDRTATDRDRLTAALERWAGR